MNESDSDEERNASRAIPDGPMRIQDEPSEATIADGPTSYSSLLSSLKGKRPSILDELESDSAEVQCGVTRKPFSLYGYSIQ